MELCVHHVILLVLPVFKVEILDAIPALQIIIIAVLAVFPALQIAHAALRHQFVPIVKLAIIFVMMELANRLATPLMSSLEAEITKFAARLAKLLIPTCTGMTPVKKPATLLYKQPQLHTV